MLIKINLSDSPARPMYVSISRRGHGGWFHDTEGHCPGTRLYISDNDRLQSVGQKKKRLDLLRRRFPDVVICLEMRNEHLVGVRGQMSPH